MREVISKLNLFIKDKLGRFKPTKSSSLKLNNSKADIPVTAMGVLVGSFLLSFVAGSIFIRPQASNAVTGLSLVGTSSMTLTASSSSVTMEITPTGSGTLASGSHTLTAGTNVPTGYSLALNTTTAANSLAATTGTLATPVVLSNNTWGFALNKVSSSSAANTITNGFDDSYATPTPSASSTWANPRTSTTIKNTTQSTSSDTTTVYYGAKADMNLTAATYSNTVRYTATANISTIPTPTITSVTPSSGTTAGGTAIQIVGTGFSVNDASVTTAVTIDGTACTNVSISSNVPSTGQDTIYCNTPAKTAGAKDVAVTTWGGSVTRTGGYMYVAPAAVTLVSPNIASTIAGTESGPSFTIVGTGFTGATSVTIGGTACASFTVVSDTQIFCKAPNTITTTGDKAIAVMKSGMASTGTVNVAYNSTAYPTLQGSDAYTQCSTTAKTYRDTRDSQLYFVKKMADNKCWMVDNLKYAGFGDLSQESGKYLTVDGTSTQSTANSDVAKYVDPGANSYCTGSTNIPGNTNTRCGLLYNWYAATGGTGTYAQSTSGNQVSASICPANFRLPSGMSGSGGATTNGTVYTAADFPVLNASMNAGSLTTGATTNYPTGWQPSGA
ncbi:MAG: IPT/TIG domain-containing protein, partial [Candidatus Saccharimonadales bacterium]